MKCKWWYGIDTLSLVIKSGLGPKNGKNYGYFATCIEHFKFLPSGGEYLVYGKRMILTRFLIAMH